MTGNNGIFGLLGIQYISVSLIKTNHANAAGLKR